MPILTMGVTSWFNNKIVEPLLEMLRRGAEPKQLAFSSALGFTLGLFPICGVTVFLCGVAIAILGSRCHPPCVMLANFVATPVELSLVVPFLRFGEIISGGAQFPLTSDAFKKVLTGQASSEVLLSIFHVSSVPFGAPSFYFGAFCGSAMGIGCMLLLGWLFAAPFILALLYVLLLPCFKVLVRRFNFTSLSPKKSEIKLKVRGI